jgi:hypothetical protein
MGRSAMPTHAEYLTTTKYCALHREMAASSLRLARRAASSSERDSYLLAAVYCVKQALRIEKAIEPFVMEIDAADAHSDLRSGL